MSQLQHAEKPRVNKGINLSRHFAATYCTVSLLLVFCLLRFSPATCTRSSASRPQVAFPPPLNACPICSATLLPLTRQPFISQPPYPRPASWCTFTQPPHLRHSAVQQRRSASYTSNNGPPPRSSIPTPMSPHLYSPLLHSSPH